MFEENNLLHELLFTTRQKNKLRNAFENNISADIELSKTEISEISQSGGFQVHYLAWRSLAPLEVTATASAIDAGIQKKIYGSGTKTLISSNEEMNDLINIVQPLDDSNVLLKRITKTTENKKKNKRGDF